MPIYSDKTKLPKSFQRVLLYFGTYKNLAKKLGVSRGSIWSWVFRKRIPFKYFSAIEELTDGEITVEELYKDWDYRRRR